MKVKRETEAIIKISSEIATAARSHDSSTGRGVIVHQIREFENFMAFRIAKIWICSPFRHVMSGTSIVSVVLSVTYVFPDQFHRAHLNRINFYAPRHFPLTQDIPIPKKECLSHLILLHINAKIGIHSRFSS